ncbi:putative amino acid permease [Nocardia neocaledoniensis NBRC 108232]|uniref:D-serine/D-alanine/glycine:proton symporter (AAT family) n=1 Tax=Nocardia neocaledoniensis TaxID=236511 RepID=A0A317NJ02_9NOCA|nr:amino acid permease [Nocardia neocaledoniensis]PWV75249.1 D-serine/D-alanine/glycine:proton symporter (AAT family) [Nocardia neocaledoniensis]GEM32799.1 putative amino acid permease [Nocardia neocaledoniensis NBRC 108232]
MAADGPGLTTEAVSAPASAADSEGYARGLSPRTIQMIAIGGAIGTGLFYGAGAAIEQAGPSLILAYLVAGLAIFVIMRALGELLTYRPVSGSFAEYAHEFLGRFAGFATGWSYWAVWVSTCMAEITVAGKYVRYWFDIPEWVTALVVLAVLFAANLISVRIFGEGEFWFSAIKVTAILAMIMIGIGVLVFGFGHAADPTVTNLWADGGVFPHGFGQTLLVLQIVVFAYVGVELVGVTAGEARDPKTTLRKAINTLPFRIGLFYVGALVVIMSVASWRSFHAGRSPFVEVFEQIGIPAAAGIINFVLLTAALSSCNSGIYSTGRMLRSLALRDEAPAKFAALSKQSVPFTGICASAGAMVIGVVVNVVSPDKAFAYITSVSTVGIIVVWSVILVCHIKYRAKVRAGELPASDYRLPGAPVTTWAALGFLGLVVVLLLWTEGGRTALLVGAVWAALVCAGYYAFGRRGVAHTA